MDEVMQALSALYNVYYASHGDVVRWRADVEEALAHLMVAYNKYMG